MRIFEVLFKGVITLFGLRTNYDPSIDCLYCASVGDEQWSASCEILSTLGCYTMVACGTCQHNPLLHAALSFSLIVFMLPQTKILEGRTNISECIFEALFNVC